MELAIETDPAGKMGSGFDPSRFRCFLAMREFEGLLFSRPAAIALSLGRPDLVGTFQAIRNSCECPEHINDRPGLSPSRRLLAACRIYSKVDGGVAAALEVGLDAMREECPHFRAWLEWLESLA